ncbi:MAG: hypothetical protein DIU71_00790 [Proteobacteria bacterium]|nr:MAG: hypothetical protein DIU71_00790 [Pseudomonadota bacterium]
MWLARPVYEFLPYLYMLIGAVVLGASWFAPEGIWPSALLVLGSLCLVGGLVVWLRRRDYRTRAAEYDSHSLDE